MCGLAGVHHFGRPDPVPAGLVRAMCETLLHRGPDEQGLYDDPAGRVALGHTRLSILDLAGGHQPMASADGQLQLVFNGEIYNYRELRARLGHRTFRTSSDTEVILHLYDEVGLDAFRQLSGMFAVALWDRRLGRLVLARDRMGIKPLYYAVDRGALLFASDVPALYRAPGLSREVDPAALRYYLAVRAVPAPRTMFRAVRKLLPGHLVVCDASGPRPPSSFWSLEGCRPGGPESEEEAAQEVRVRLQRAVRSHMIADVPVGAFLSGGLDSSLIVACMRQETAGEIETFSVGFEDEGYAEFPYARLVAGRFGTRHHEYVMTPRDFLEFLPRMVGEFGDPVADPAAVPLYYLSRVVRERGIKVMLSGEGSDELFAGYHGYQAAAPVAPWRAAWRLSRHLLSRRAPRARAPYAGHSAIPDLDLLDALLPHGEDRGLPLLEAYRRTAAEAGMDALQTMLFLDLKTRIPEDLLSRTDRMTMANSVEARVPFLDHELVEFAFWLPSGLKMRGGHGKHVLKRAAEPLLPPEIISRRKMGFPTPIRRWLTGTLREVFTRGLLDIREEPAIIDHALLERLLAEHVAGRDDLSLLLWRVWFFKLWFAYWNRGERVELAVA
jgi:asparagine synthase (glutamine-hydrolysing)